MVVDGLLLSVPVAEQVFRGRDSEYNFRLDKILALIVFLEKIGVFDDMNRKMEICSLCIYILGHIGRSKLD